MTIYEQRQRAGFRQWPTGPREPGANPLKHETRIDHAAADRERALESGLRNEVDRLAPFSLSVRLEDDIFQLI